MQEMGRARPQGRFGEEWAVVAFARRIFVASLRLQSFNQYARAHKKAGISDMVVVVVHPAALSACRIYSLIPGFPPALLTIMSNILTAGAGWESGIFRVRGSSRRSLPNLIWRLKAEIPTGSYLSVCTTIGLLLGIISDRLKSPTFRVITQQRTIYRQRIGRHLGDEGRNVSQSCCAAGHFRIRRAWVRSGVFVSR